MDYVSKIKKKSRISRRFDFADVIIYMAAGIAAAITLWPFIYIFSMSISEPSQVLAKSVWLLPKGFDFTAYKNLISNTFLWQSFINSVFYTFTGTFLNLLTAVLAAYPLARKTLFARKFFVFYLIIPMYFTGGLIPFYLLIVRLGMYNTIWALIIPTMVSIWNIILVRSYFCTLPESLNESAKIEGANDFQILFKIIVPLSKPILAVIALYSGVSIWNSWFNAMLFVPNQKLQPLQLFLAKVLVFDGNMLKTGIEEATAKALIRNAAVMVQMKYAVIIFCALPIICLYPFLQKYFVKGAILGSLKG